MEKGWQTGFQLRSSHLTVIIVTTCRNATPLETSPLNAQQGADFRLSLRIYYLQGEKTVSDPDLIAY